MQVLLIHDSQAVRSIFRRYFAAEFGEDKLYCVTSAEALAALGAQTFDLIFSGIEMMFMDGFEIHRSILSTPNADTPFVALSSNRSSKQLQKFAAHNIKTYLLTPFSPMALRQMIITCYNPQLRRSSARYGIPDSAVVVQTAGQELHGTLINVSLTGLLCRLPLPERQADLYSPVSITIYFPQEFQGIRVESIRATMLRLRLTDWTPWFRATHGNAAWQFIEVQRDALGALQRVFEQAHQAMLQSGSASPEDDE